MIQPPLFSTHCSSSLAIADPDHDEKAMLRDLRDWGWIITRCEYDDDEYVEALQNMRWTLGKRRLSGLVNRGGAQTLKQIWTREGKKKVYVDEERFGCSIEEDGRYRQDDTGMKHDEERVYSDDGGKDTFPQNNLPATDIEMARQQKFLGRIRRGEEMIQAYIYKEEKRLQARSQNLQPQTHHQPSISDPHSPAKYYKHSITSTVDTTRRNTSALKPSPYPPQYTYDPPPLPLSPGPPRRPASIPKIRNYILRYHKQRQQQRQQQQRKALQTPSIPQAPIQATPSSTTSPPYERDLQYPLLFPNQHHTVEGYMRFYRPVPRASQTYALRLERAGLGEDPYGWLEWDRRVQMQKGREKERLRVVREKERLRKRGRQREKKENGRVWGCRGCL